MLTRALLAALVAAGLAACTVTPVRGYYRPAGQAPSESIGVYVEQGPEAVVEAVCQGAYANRVDGRRTSTVHVQLDVARTRSGDLVLPRALLVADVEPVGGGPRQRLHVSEAWSGREPAPADLVVPGWTRRPFDLFFDDDDLLANGPPPSVLVSWVQREGDDEVPAQCLFVLVPGDEPGGPALLPPADEAFGLRHGYYLPGVQLGERRLRTAGEERLHHLFHAPEGWLW